MSRAALPTVPPIDVAGLRDALDRTGAEVRFDRLSRALYSTDASVYQIVPLGVVLPRSEADILATVQACSRFGVPLTARGGGTSQAGQCIGVGVILDCSKQFNAVLEVNAAERWARVQPGCVLDDLNDAVKPLGLHFAPDISTSNRATIGGMIANNSSGTHSVIYGKTIDHVLEMKAVLADGNVIEARPLDEAELEAKCGQQDREGECHRVVRRLAAEHAGEIERRFPKLLRRVGGYNLDEFALCSRDAVGGMPTALRGHASARLHAHAKPWACHPEIGPASRPHQFNLAHLLVGSEGTLAVSLEAKVRLMELPRAKAVVVLQFADLLDALAATPAILSHGPSAVEVIDQYILNSTKLNLEASRLRGFLHGDPDAILIVEFYADDPDELSPSLDELEADMRQSGLGTHFYRAMDVKRQAEVWKLRKLALGLSMAEKGDAKALSFVEDTAVAPERLRDYIAEFLEVVRRHGTTAGVYAHASVGCLHVRPVIDLKTEDGVRRFDGIAHDVAALVLKYGGALSGEHGDGLVRSPFQERMFGPVLYDAFRQIKRAFDPQCILNPGKIVDAPPLTTNLRYGPKYVTPDVPTTFDFSVDGGIVRAAELCAGVGECRKTRDGTMCPSYQATRDEQHSTRGRANVLRLALTGQLDMHGLTDEAVKDALDLCLECKACKSECPTNVDMARLKAEFLHQYFQKHRLPWRNWVFGNVATISRYARRFAPVSNRFTRSRPVRWLGEQLLGIDRRRIPPSFARKDLIAVFIHDRLARLKSRRLTVRSCRQGCGGLQQSPFLFPDTFANHYEPHVGMAALRFLEYLGCQIFPGFPWPLDLSRIDQQTCHYPSGLRCCGRPLISNGLLPQAAENARQNVARLYPQASEDGLFIACEPSCILTIKDDYPALLRGEERRKAEVVATACQTFEEFADSLLASQGASALGALRGLTPPARRIFVHVHCHQRALVGVGPTLRLLRRIRGAEVIDLDAGCCGMAGSFGYEKEHYEVSRLVGEQRLFPAVRAMGPDDILVASGFSCRLQIEHFTGRKAIHPAELLARLCEPSGP